MSWTVNVIGFSKDRPAVLDLCLRSYAKHFTGGQTAHVTVIVRATSPEDREAYDLVRRLHPWAHLVDETAIDADIRRAFLAVQASYTQFFVDDDVFIRDFGPDDPEWLRLAGRFVVPFKMQLGPGDPEVIRAETDPLIAAVVCRMAPYMDYCYSLNTVTPPPMMTADRLWYWPTGRGDWRYPHSVDGTVWRTDDVAPVLLSGLWRSIHELEPALIHAFGNRPLALCYDQPRLVNIVCDSVQDCTLPNRNPGLGVQSGTQRFLNGERLSLESIESMPVQRAPHVEWQHCWTGR